MFQREEAPPLKLVSIRIRAALPFALLCLTALPAAAQLSFTTAVDLALRNSPRVKAAEADVAKAIAQLDQLHDAYIPAISGGSGLGYSYGFPIGTPSVFNFTAQSLVFNYSQKNYVRAGRDGMDAANLTLMDVRQQVAEDAAVTYIALDHDLQRQTAINAQSGFAKKLSQIVQDRIDAGQDAPQDLLRARRTATQLRLAALQLDEDIDIRRDHLARLTGLAAAGLTTLSQSIPAAPPLAVNLDAQNTPGIQAAYAAARAKRQLAFGDARRFWRPEIYFAAQYNYLAPFNNYQDYYKQYNANSLGIGVQITVPLLDAGRRDKAKESAAEATRAYYEANTFRDAALEARLKLSRTTQELSARLELSSIDRALAQAQLDALLIQLNASSSSPGAVQLTPKDEQNARIEERQRFLDLLDADFLLRQTQINLLRQTGQLEGWLKSAPANLPAAPTPQP